MGCLNSSFQSCIMRGTGSPNNLLKGDMTLKKALVLLLSLTLLSIATPVSSASGPVGARIDILRRTPTSFHSSTPFHVEHGWTGDVPIPPKYILDFDFIVEIDGIRYSTEDYRRISNSGGVYQVNLGYNFPAGLPVGRHVFIGHWYVSCQYYVELGEIPGPCTSPSYEMFTFTLTVAFHRFVRIPREIE